jgi:hypothetical protein
MLKYSLAAADVHWISLKPQLEGLIVPSKFYGVAAAGRAIVAIAAKNGEIAQLVEQNGCGVVVEPGDANGLAQILIDCQAIPNGWQKWVDAHEKCWRHILHVNKLLKDGALCSVGPRLRPFLFETKAILRQHRQHGLRSLRMTARPSGGLLSRPRFFEGRTLLTVLTIFSRDERIVITLLPARPSRVKAISIPSARRDVCARRKWPARARGFFGQPVPPSGYDYCCGQR